MTAFVSKWLNVGRDNRSGIVGEELAGGKWNRNYAEMYSALALQQKHSIGKF